MVEIDWRSIARVHRLMGGEGSNLLQLKSKAKLNVEMLDAAIPDDAGDGPANGGWFWTPSGPMLFIEGLSEAVNPWIEQLAERLAGAGVEGVLAGGRSVNQTTIKWAMEIEESVFRPRPGHEDDPVFPRWCGLLGYRSVPNWWEAGSWSCGADALDAATTHALNWMTAGGGRVLADVDLRADFWVDRATAEAIFKSQAASGVTGGGVTYLFNEDRREIRTVRKSWRNEISLVAHSATATWQDMIANLRAALLSAPLEWVSIAMISHVDWGALLSGVDKYYDASGYRWYPDRWGDFGIDPCGIQILTDKHLAKVHNLSEWQTTRLDAEHFLVESRDLGAWYGRPMRLDDRFEVELMSRARADFGEMILTPARAREEEMVGNPRFK